MPVIAGLTIGILLIGIFALMSKPVSAKTDEKLIAETKDLREVQYFLSKYPDSKTLVDRQANNIVVVSYQIDRIRCEPTGNFGDDCIRTLSLDVVIQPSDQIEIVAGCLGPISSTYIGDPIDYIESGACLGLDVTVTDDLSAIRLPVSDMKLDGAGNIWITQYYSSHVLMFAVDYGGEHPVVDFATPTVDLRVGNPNPNPLVADTVEITFDRLGNLWTGVPWMGETKMFSDGDSDPSTSKFFSGQDAMLVFDYWPDLIVDHAGNLWVNDGSGSRVSVFSDGDNDLSTTRFVARQNATKIIDFEPYRIEDKIFDSAGNMWVAARQKSVLSDRVLMFSDGDDDPRTINFESGQSPMITLDIDADDDLILDSAGNLWVSGRQGFIPSKGVFVSNGIFMFSDEDNDPSTSLFVDDQEPTLLLQSARDTIEDRFSSPSAIAIDKFGNLWVYTKGYYSNRILMFSDGDDDPSTMNFVDGQNATSVYKISLPREFPENG